MTEQIRTALEAVLEVRIQHAHFLRAVDELFNAMVSVRPGEVVLAVGPSRVGKTSAIAEALERIYGPSAERGLNRIPYVLVEAGNTSGGGAFSTKAFMWDACKAIKHPFYGSPTPDDPQGDKLHHRIYRTPESVLRSAFEHATSAMGTQFFVIDEAQHFKYVAGRGRAEAVLNSLKCLANTTGMVLVLVGSYELLDMLCLAPHMIGRQVTIEFPRYRADLAHDRKAFRGVLAAWSKLLPFDQPATSLLTWTKFLHEQTFGCVGLLSVWLRAALASALSANESTFTLAALSRTRMAFGFKDAIQREIDRGEQLIGELRGEVDLPAPGSGGNPVDQSGSNGAQPPSPRKKKPFKRESKRHPLGGRA
ncbi:AAA family ATPase [Dokdonella sp. MW10]|uniref:ATP-binding protein n=1 Tax=Dokdonella sp. MW10 TaxID=2992926 RepID=UPI003F80BAB0